MFSTLSMQELPKTDSNKGIIMHVPFNPSLLKECFEFSNEMSELIFGKLQYATHSFCHPMLFSSNMTCETFTPLIISMS
jgi:hypothetical protein